jgi:hypothetical protein
MSINPLVAGSVVITRPFREKSNTALTSARMT